MGSTAAPINAIMQTETTIDQKELCFSSRHPTGVNLSFADDHLQFIDQNVEPSVYSSIGTRSSGEAATKIQ